MKKLFLLTAVFMLLAACAPAQSTPTPLAVQNGIEIEQASVRIPGGDTAKAGSNTSLAGYMVIKNTGSTDDSLVSVQADFAGMTMLHQSTVDSNGVASMKMVMSIDVPAGQTVELQPGGFHVMFQNLKQDLKVGDTVTLELHFKQAGTIKVQAQVTNA